MTAPHGLEIRLLGRFVVVRDGSEVAAADFGGRKVRTLLRILATRRGELVSHDFLTDALWADRPPADPVANLQVLVNRARKALGRTDLLETGSGGYCLAAGHDCVIDAEQFLQAVVAAEAMEGIAAIAGYRAALAGWRGEPLSEDAYSSWASEYRDRLMRVRQQALEAAAILALRWGQTSTAVQLAATAAALEPLREIAVLTLVRAFDAAGDRVTALERYEQYRRALAEDLGLDPSEEAVEVQSSLLRGGASGARHIGTARPQPDFGVLPFVGRAHEVETLSSVLARGGTALVVGASGTGKSRLLDVLAARRATLSVRAFLAERDEPWSLVRSLLREILATDVTAAAQLPAQLRSALAWLLPEYEPERPEQAPADPDAASRRSLLLEAATRLLAAADADVFVDDLQWADASSLWLLEAAAARLIASGWVLAYRPEELLDGSPAFDFAKRVRGDAVVIELEPFDADAIGQLSGDEALTAALVSATDGTPLAVTEVLRTLAGEQAIAPAGDQRWRPLTSHALVRAAEVAIEGQRTGIAARAAAQPPAARELIELLALVAREVPARTLALASGRSERDVLDDLGVLSRFGLARLGERGWATSHDMVGDVVAGSLSRSDRGRLHAQLAAALQQEHPDAEPSELARHWLAAGDRPRAAEAYLAASARALDAFADGEAAALATAGLDSASPGPLSAALHEIRAQALARTGDLPAARHDLREAMQVHARGPARARLLVRLATLASGADDLVRAAELAELALVEAGSDAAARAHALEVAAVLDMNLDRAERATSRAAEALTLFQQHGDANGAARILDSRAMATFLDGSITDGTTLLDRAANLFEDSGDLVHVITPRSTAGHGLVFAEQAEAGLQKTTAALELARTIGHAEGQAYALWHTTEALAAAHRGDEALAAGNEALAIATRIGHRGWTATAWRALGIARQTLDDSEQALHAFRCSLDVSEHLNLFASWAAARSAAVLIELGRLAEAAPMVDRALAEGPALGHYEARLAQVELAAARADPRTASLAEAALAAADAGGMRQGRDRLVSLLSLAT